MSSQRERDLLALRVEVDKALELERGLIRQMRTLELKRAALLDTQEGFIRRIMDVVSSVYHVAPDEILSDARHHYLIEPRWVIIWCLRERGFSLADIGKIMGRHHTSVMHSLRAIENNQGTLAIARQTFTQELAA